jgi:cell division septation protein DedD
MPTMVTFPAGRVALAALLAGIVCACGQEQQDWRSAESADTTEAWQRFVDQHPDSELVNEARNRIAELDARRDFQYADRVGTVEAYRDFLAHHPSGRWSEHARIRIESFALGSAPRIAPPTPEEAAAFGGSGVRALRLATAALPEGEASTVEGVAPAAEAAPATGDAGQVPGARAVPGEAAQAAEEAVVRPIAAAETDQGGYGVQLGAFGSEASADREWRRLQGRFGAALGNLSPRIVVAESDSRQLYRLQVAASGEAQARAICDSLKEQAQACVPVVPR